MYNDVLITFYFYSGFLVDSSSQHTLDKERLAASVHPKLYLADKIVYSFILCFLLKWRACCSLVLLWLIIIPFINH